mmetsp:Transcript_9032/g.21551  ORF Transcript_9032/g.21551 Transcript_9032/m.21551 type:complete len:187 (-) Transcript_9032:3-563(-)
MVVRLLVLAAVLVAAVVDGTSSFRSNLLQRLRRTQQPWAWMPPIPMGPRAVLPTVDGGGPVFPGLINNPPHTHPTVPPLKDEDGKVLRLPPPGLEGWYIKPPPGPLYEGWKHYEDAGEEEPARYFLRCLGGPYPCGNGGPYTTPQPPPPTEPPTTTILTTSTTPMPTTTPPPTTTAPTTTPGLKFR